MRAGSRFPTFSPSLDRPSHPHPTPFLQSGIFSPVSTGAGCNLATPIIADGECQWISGAKRVKEREREKEWSASRERAGCYICNVFSFTIFQLVCILEPLFVRFYSLDFSLLLFAMFESSLAGCCTLDAFPFPLELLPSSRNNFIRSFFLNA